MLQRNFIRQWVCECSTVNPLRKRSCINCSGKISKKTMEQIYVELKFKNSFLVNLEETMKFLDVKKLDSY